MKHKTKNFDEWREYIVTTLEKIGQLDGRSELLSAQLASSLLARDMLMAEMEREDFSVIQTEVSREGDPRAKVNEVFSTFIRLQDVVRKDMDALLLTLPMKGKFDKGDDGNPMDDITSRLLG